MTDDDLKLQVSITGTKRYSYEWQYHRDNGPAIQYANGEEYWYQHGKLHRIGGPAVSGISGYKMWCVNDKKHRTDGPAVVDPRKGVNEWWLEGVEYNCMEWMLKVHEMDQHG